MDNAFFRGISQYLESTGGIAPYGLRYGGDVPLGQNPMPKGLGWFGAVPNSQGGASTEISSDNRPLMVPTLDASELRLLMSGGSPTEEIYRKVAQWAAAREAQSQSPFAGPSDIRFPMPAR